MPITPDLIQSMLQSHPTVNRLVVGFSGGLDSTVLLHLAWRWQQQHPQQQLLAIHVNHQLQAPAADWQHHCEQICHQWQIPFQAEVVTINLNEASLEQAARRSRYSAFARHLQAGDALLLAHHRDDQVETLFQRLLRGSGPLGLGAMQEQSIHAGQPLLRPLLEQDRSALEDYAREHHLRWVEDPTNQTPDMERNFLRQRVLPTLRTRWPGLNRTVARAARLSRESADLLDDLACLDGEGQCRAGQPLPVSLLTPLSEARRRNLLRYWMTLQGATLPSEAQLQQVQGRLLDAAEDTQPLVRWGNYQLRRYRQALYCLPLLPEPVPSLAALPLGQLVQAGPDGLPWCAGRLVSTTGQGVAFSRTRLLAAPLSLRLRQGGERAKPVGRNTNSLKHWLQAYEVPPWWRERWPLLYCGEQLAGLPGLWVCQGFEPADMADSLWLDWQPPKGMATGFESPPRIG